LQVEEFFPPADDPRLYACRQAFLEIFRTELRDAVSQPNSEQQLEYQLRNAGKEIAWQHQQILGLLLALSEPKYNRIF